MINIPNINNQYQPTCPTNTNQPALQNSNSTNQANQANQPNASITQDTQTSAA